MKKFEQLNHFDIKTFIDTDAVRLTLLALVMSIGLYLIHNLSLFY